MNSTFHTLKILEEVFLKFIAFREKTKIKNNSLLIDKMIEFFNRHNFHPDDDLTGNLQDQIMMVTELDDKNTDRIIKILRNFEKIYFSELMYKNQEKEVVIDTIFEVLKELKNNQSDNINYEAELENEMENFESEELKNQISKIEQDYKLLEKSYNELKRKANNYLKIFSAIQEEKPSFGKPFFKVNLTKEELDNLKR